MNEKENKKLLNYKKCLNKKRTNWINRIRFWKYIKEDLENSIKENYKKQDKIIGLKNELSATQIPLNIACEKIKQLEYDLKQKEKKNRKKKENK